MGTVGRPDGSGNRWLTAAVVWLLADDPAAPATVIHRRCLELLAAWEAPLRAWQAYLEAERTQWPPPKPPAVLVWVPEDVHRAWTAWYHGGLCERRTQQLVRRWRPVVARVHPGNWSLHAAPGPEGEAARLWWWFFQLERAREPGHEPARRPARRRGAVCDAGRRPVMPGEGAR